jgi:hypothetical protein
MFAGVRPVSGTAASPAFSGLSANFAKCEFATLWRAETGETGLFAP